MVQVGGFEPPTLRVSDENSKPTELHLHIGCSGFALPGTLRNVVERYEALSVQSSWQNPHAPRVLRGIFYFMNILYHTF